MSGTANASHVRQGPAIVYCGEDDLEAEKRAPARPVFDNIQRRITLRPVARLPRKFVCFRFQQT
jgi:hypothetical protein